MTTCDNSLPVPGLPDDMALPVGMAVMVPVGAIAAEINGHPTVIAMATVMGQASPTDREVIPGDAEVWWLEVHAGHGARLPQMYRRGEILGVPAVGLNAGPGYEDPSPGAASDHPVPGTSAGG